MKKITISITLLMLLISYTSIYAQTEPCQTINPNPQANDGAIPFVDFNESPTLAIDIVVPENETFEILFIDLFLANDPDDGTADDINFNLYDDENGLSW